MSLSRILENIFILLGIFDPSPIIKYVSLALVMTYLQCSAEHEGAEKK